MKSTLIVFTMAISFVTGMNAQTVSSPTFIISGNPISASEMNAYLGTLVTAINTLQTKVTALEAANAVFPIGAIIASFVAPTNGYMTGSGDVWKLADGSTMPATYTAVAGLPNPATDMRGQFLRGMNVSGGGVDPDPRVVGSVQADAFQGHAHKWLHQWGGINGIETAVGTSNSNSSVDNAPWKMPYTL